MPLADKMRPKTLDEVAGQKHLLGKNAPFRRIAESGRLPSLVFYGPPGTGKTTIADIIAHMGGKSLYKVNATVASTGEVKDTFKFTYNGRRYDWLSLSEKIRAGMEVSELMKRLTGRNYPQFVDNMESVDDLSNVRPTGQVIMAKCVSKAELSVRPVKPILTAMPTAA